MNRVLSSLAAALVTVASMGAVPVPNDQQAKQTPVKSVPKVTKVTKHPSGKKPAQAQGREQKPYQVGMASWYGKQFHGRATASGEDFDMFELTAAHRQLPLGTYVKVTNLRNGKWVVVRVNDRGPFVEGRIMDLSYGAARMISFRDGIERVRLDVMRPETVAQAGGN
ncbi:MAG TPA: septal ring lytic transglycosylase RlpA family protein [Candidatus Angelobacter sp.]